MVGCTYARSYNVPQWRRSEGIGIGRIGSFDLRRGKLNKELSHTCITKQLIISIYFSHESYGQLKEYSHMTQLYASDTYIPASLVVLHLP